MNAKNIVFSHYPFLLAELMLKPHKDLSTYLLLPTFPLETQGSIQCVVLSTYLILRRPLEVSYTENLLTVKLRTELGTQICNTVGFLYTVLFFKYKPEVKVQDDTT